MSEPPGKAALPSGFGDDRASNGLARAELITSIQELSQLQEPPVDALIERLRRLDTPKLEGLIQALRRILAQAITVSAERPEAESLALSSQAARSAATIRTSERTEFSLPQTAAQTPSTPNELLRGRASSIRIANVFFISISIALGATIGIFAFTAQNSSSLSHPKSSASRFDATTSSPNNIAPELTPTATRTSFAEASSSKVVASQGDFQIEAQNEASVLATRAPVWPLVTDESYSANRNSARSATSTSEDARASSLPAQHLVLAGTANSDSAQRKKNASGTSTHEGGDVSETGMLLQTMAAKPNSNDTQHTDQDHVERAEATDVSPSGSSHPFTKGAVVPGSDKVERPQIGAGSPNSAELHLLLERADRSLKSGDISAARLFYERAAQVGSVAGAVGVGKTYDPLFLTQLGARGLRGDAVLASWWYQKASNAGDQEAAMRLYALTANANQ
jgi:hypothetical protein